MRRSWTGHSIVNAAASGPALFSTSTLSFLGDIDIRTGNVVEKSSDLLGKSVARTVLVVSSTKGSTGAWRFIYQLFQHGTHPVAIITEDLPDPSVVQGAIMCKIPIVSRVALSLLAAGLPEGTVLNVDGNKVSADR